MGALRCRPVRRRRRFIVAGLRLDRGSSDAAAAGPADSNVSRPGGRRSPITGGSIVANSGTIGSSFGRRWATEGACAAGGRGRRLCGETVLCDCGLGEGRLVSRRELPPR